MIVLPIVDRELRVAARRPAIFRTRLLAAVAAIVLASWKALDLAAHGVSPSAQGQSLFYVLSGLAFAYCLCIGAHITSDCISQEKREGTLGLLFLTDLTGMDVVLGKLVASSLNSFYGLLATMPLLAMPLLMGGVTLKEFGQMVLVLLNTLFFSMSVGLLVSALSRNERKAMLGTLVGTVGMAVAPFLLLYFVVEVLGWAEDINDIVIFLPWLAASPISPFVLALPTVPFPLRIPPASFLVCMAVLHTFSWAALLVTARLVPGVWKEKVKAAEPVLVLAPVEQWRAWAYGTTEQRHKLRLRLLGRNPFLWLVSRDRLKPAYAWFFLVSMIGVWLWGYWQHEEVMFDFYPLVPSVLMVHCFLKVWVVSEVSHRLVQDQRSGAMELLLSTPLTMEDILRGQRKAVVRQFGLPVLALCAIELVAFRTSFPLSLIVPVLAILVLDLFTLIWVALRLSLVAHDINEVLWKSLLWVLALPWGLWLLTQPLFRFAWHGLLGWNRYPGWPQRVFWWFIVAALLDLWLILFWARPHLVSRQSQHGAMAFGESTTRPA